MPFKPEELSVIIPYTQLMGLLNASQRVEELNQKMERVLTQQEALRGQFMELMDAFRQLM